ncbi:hypothetical protein GE09DRAFT_1293597 [Coniochaeta sp. 2T2.1]|nr:hypothetical protein GE09DRAFT_1293597 [Coniochaeta sp. 2T2.1]
MSSHEAALASESWAPRFRTFSEDDGSAKLGQHNADDSTSTRTKITHLEFAGFGLVGSVSSVAYGSWMESKAMLLVMQFDFRAKQGALRFKRAEICVSFEAQTSSSQASNHRQQPVVCRIIPADNRSRSPPASSSSSKALTDSDVGNFTWPSGEYSVSARKWTGRDSEVENEIIWKLQETKGSKFGICDSIRLAAVVAWSGPFKATVDVSATTALGVQLRNLPWSKDDPLLFDGVTCKGIPLPDSDFSTLDPRVLAQYVCEAKSMSLPAAVAGLVAPEENVVPISQKQRASSTVYRVRGIPRSYNRAELIRVLSTTLKVDEHSIHICSFAPNPYRPEKMAVVSFDSELHELQRTPTKYEWTVCAKQEEKPLLFDTNFLGFTSLGREIVESSESHVDIIGIHGLGGHAYGSFKERGGTYMWLEDSLPTDLFAHGSSAGTIARVILYGYDSHIEKSDSLQGIRDLASKLRVSLRAIRKGIAKHRPIIFIGHSLGGLLLKELLILLCDADADQDDRANLDATLGALFFGVPNRGMDNTALLSIIETQPNSALVNELSIGSAFLQNQAEVFPMAFGRRDSIIFSFHETRLSGTAMMVNGQLTMKGPPVVLVNKESATHGRPWERSPRFVIPIDRSHSDIVKFERFSNDYEAVLTYIRELLQLRFLRQPQTV